MDIRQRRRPRTSTGVDDVPRGMLALWLDDMESLEAISQDENARRIFLRMSALSQSGRTPSLLAEIAGDSELDDATKLRLAELAQDQSFLLAVEEYLVRTHQFH